MERWYEFPEFGGYLGTRQIKVSDEDYLLSGLDCVVTDNLGIGKSLEMSYR